MREAAATLGAVVLAYNEERNLPACLESLAGWVGEIVVVDSGSTDATADIARRHGARVATHPFETHARQWNWALANVPLAGAWVLALDADQRVTPELAREIGAAVARDDGVCGYYVNRRQVFRGRWIRHGGYYPKYLLKLFRRGEGWADEADLVDHHFRVRGRVARLRGDIVEDNRTEADIAVWVAKHVRYAALQARQEAGLVPAAAAGALPVAAGSPDARVARMKSVWAHLPLYLRPCLYFAYRYVLRLGFLDGKEGFVFHFLQAWWYRLLVDIELDELRRRQRGC